MLKTSLTDRVVRPVIEKRKLGQLGINGATLKVISVADQIFLWSSASYCASVIL